MAAISIAKAADDPTILAKEVEWKPVTSAQRWQIYRNNTYESTGAYTRVVITAGLDQWRDRPPSWPQGMEGYGRRVGQRFATFTLQDSAEAGLTAIAGYEPRYVRCKCSGVKARVAHAIKMNFLTLDRNGNNAFDWPKFASAYGVGMLATTWVNDYKWSAQGIQSGNSQLYFGVAFSIAREFGPEIKKVFRRK